MQKIDFFIAGVQKSATTSLYDILSTDKRIYMPAVKENPYFTNCNIKEDFFVNLYSKYNSEELVGGAYANAIFFKDAAKKLFENNRKIKIIIILRNPIDRAYSAYNYLYNLGIEKAKSFELAIENESQNRFSSYVDIANKTYLQHGYYYRQIINYLKIIPLKQLHFIFFDDFINNQNKVVKDIYEFLDLNYLDDYEYKKSNSSFSIKNKLLHHILYNENILKSIYHKVFPKKIRFYLNHTLIKKIEHLNRYNNNYASMNPKTRKKLQDYYLSENKNLQNFLKKDLKHWMK